MFVKKNKKNTEDKNISRRVTNVFIRPPDCADSYDNNIHKQYIMSDYIVGILGRSKDLLKYRLKIIRLSNAKTTHHLWWHTLELFVFFLVPVLVPVF